MLPGALGECMCTASAKHHTQSGPTQYGETESIPLKFPHPTCFCLVQTPMCVPYRIVDAQHWPLRPSEMHLGYHNVLYRRTAAAPSYT